MDEAREHSVGEPSLLRMTFGYCDSSSNDNFLTGNWMLSTLGILWRSFEGDSQMQHPARAVIYQRAQRRFNCLPLFDILLLQCIVRVFNTFD